MLTMPADLVSASMWTQMERSVERLAAARLAEDFGRAEFEVRQAFAAIHKRAGRGKVSEYRRNQVYGRDGWACVVCGFFNQNGRGLSLDHLYPVVYGGCHEPWNLGTLCGPCNRVKGNSLIPWALWLMIRQARGEGV